MDRFKPPELHEEPIVNCDNCGSEKYYDNLYWDEYSEKYFCDKTCFYEWADANIEIVCDYYWNMNIDY